MGFKNTPVEIETIAHIADRLRAIAEKFGKATVALQEVGEKELLFPWNKRQENAFDVISDASTELEKCLDHHIDAIKQKRKSVQQQAIERRENRHKKTKSPAKPVGRPRKASIASSLELASKLPPR
jgi:uncharacterized coiled-coil protein SlyX